MWRWEWSGADKAQARPPTPITAGGLFGMFYATVNPLRGGSHLLSGSSPAIELHFTEQSKMSRNIIPGEYSVILHLEYF